MYDFKGGFSMNKKILSLVISTVLIMSVLSGCGSNSEVLEEVTTDNMATQNTAANNGETQTVNDETTKNNTAETTAMKQETSEMIGEDAATEIALEKLPGATKSDVRIHYDRDDGRDIYEGSVVYNEMEYDFEIDAMTGEVIEWESESIYD